MEKTQDSVSIFMGPACGQSGISLEGGGDKLGICPRWRGGSDPWRGGYFLWVGQTEDRYQYWTTGLVKKIVVCWDGIAVLLWVVDMCSDGKMQGKCKDANPVKVGVWSVWLIVSGNRMQQMWFDKLHHATQLEKRNSTGISQHGIGIELTLFHGNKAVES